MFQKLWADDSGALIATEWVFVATILVLGIITGLIGVQASVVSELHEFASAVLVLDQSYSFSGASNCLSSTAGSAGTDTSDIIQAAFVDPNDMADINQAPCD